MLSISHFAFFNTLYLVMLKFLISLEFCYPNASKFSDRYLANSAELDQTAT